MGDVLALPSAVRDHPPVTLGHPDGAVTFTALSAATTARTVVTVRTQVVGADESVYLVFTREADGWSAHGLDAGSARVTIPPGLVGWLEDVVATAARASA